MRYLVLVLVLVGCADLFGPDVRYWNRRPMVSVPEEYPVWYAEVEDCLGMTGDFGAVEWFVADSIIWQGADARGLTAHLIHEVTIRSDHVASSHVVRHEMVHDILQAGVEIHDERDNVPCEVSIVS